MSASPSWVGASSPPASRYTYLRPSPPVSDRSVPLITRLRTASLLNPRISAASLSVTLLVANPSPPRLPAHLVGILPLPTLAQALRRQRPPLLCEFRAHHLITRIRVEPLRCCQPKRARHTAKSKSSCSLSRHGSNTILPVAMLVLRL